MTTFEKVWQVQTVNQSIDNVDTAGTRSAYLYRLVEMLTTAGTGAWTVVKSCDGTTASDNDSQDWTSAAKVVFGNSGAPVNDGDMGNGAAHSWIELKSPANFPTLGKYMYLLIDAANYDYDTYGPNCQIHWGTETAVADTGTTLRRPTLAVSKWNSWNAWTMPYNLTFTYGSPYDTASNAYFASYKALSGWKMTFDYDASHVNYFHGARTSDGYFFCMNTMEGQGYVFGGGFILPLDTPRTKEVDPWPIVGAFGSCTNSGSTVGFFTKPSHDYTNITNGCILGSDYAATNGALNIRTFALDGDTQSGGTTGIHGNFLQSLGGVGYWASDVQDNTGNSIDSKLTALPVWVGNSPTGGYLGTRGRIVDLKLGPTGTSPRVPQATVEPASGTVESVFLGDYWWPLNATPVI